MVNYGPQFVFLNRQRLLKIRVRTFKRGRQSFAKLFTLFPCDWLVRNHVELHTQFQIKYLQITMFLRFEILRHAKNHGERFLKLCQTSFRKCWRKWSETKINRPNPQNPGRPTCQKKQKWRKRKTPKDWRTNLAKHETAPEFVFFFFKSYRNIDHEWNYKIGIHQLGRKGGGEEGGGNGLKIFFVPW